MGSAIRLGDTLTIRVSTRALLIAGLDDPARFADIERRPFNAHLTACTGRGKALQELVDELYDRATEGADGYGHPSTDKRILKRELKQLETAYGLVPRP